ncbi:S1 family peptidase [Streptomyces odontomachi]|uniref:S1 family peptidase n=1 Tax=Streptomyces odontomachi TaxID=2944940 RepID=UPI00210E12B6|nr:S1 family peptidase [Streptomyces sp. ODS25]
MRSGSAPSARPGRNAGVTRRAGALAAVCGLLAATAVAALAPAATAAGRTSTPPTGAKADAAQLAAADATLRRANVGGTAWYADPATGHLVVTADRTVSREAVARIEAAVRDSAPAALEIHRTAGRIAEHTAGGDPIIGPGARCAVGFNVQDAGGTKYALTAGHCTQLGGTWSPVGEVASSSFPGNDYGLLRYADPSQAEGGVRGPGGTLIDIVNARNPVVGEKACVSAPSGIHCGTVTGLNATVNYGDGVVSGLIQTNLCTEPGDSGAPLYAGSSALGIVSGGSGDCTSGGTTYFQPVLEPLSAFGVSVF